MATQSKSKAKAPAAKAGAKRTTTTPAVPAVDLPVGAVLTVTERVGELVEPFSGREAAKKQIKSYRTELRRHVKRTERRGTTARRRATAEVRKTRDRIERQARERRNEIESTVKRNRSELGERVRKARDLLPV